MTLNDDLELHLLSAWITGVLKPSLPSAGDPSQGFTLARQALNQLREPPSPGVACRC